MEFLVGHQIHPWKTSRRLYSYYYTIMWIRFWLMAKRIKKFFISFPHLSFQTLIAIIPSNFDIRKNENDSSFSKKWPIPFLFPSAEKKEVRKEEIYLNFLPKCRKLLLRKRVGLSSYEIFMVKTLVIEKPAFRRNSWNFYTSRNCFQQLFVLFPVWRVSPKLNIQTRVSFLEENPSGSSESFSDER